MKIKKLYKSLWFQVFFASVVSILAYNAFSYAEDAEAWMPDPYLERAVREKLEFPDEIPMLPEDMAELYDLVVCHI